MENPQDEPLEKDPEANPPDQGSPHQSSPPDEAEKPAPSLEEEKKGKGPTILGLLALFTLLMVMGAILVPNFLRARARGSLTACKSNLKNIGSALEMYSTDWSGKYPTSLNALTPNYLKSIPECPSAGSMTYRVYFGPNARCNPDHYEDYYYVECYGQNHDRVSVTGNYPAYNGIQGLIERAP